MDCRDSPNNTRFSLSLNMAAHSPQFEFSRPLSTTKGEIRRRTSNKSARTMLSFWLSSSSSPRTFSMYNINRPILTHQTKLFAALPRASSSFVFNAIRFSVNNDGMAVVKKQNRRGSGAFCYSAPVTARNLQWISTVSSAGEYGIWAAFLALLVHLFFFIPGELELPFVALLLVNAAPYQVMNLRGTQQGAIIAMVIAGYLAFQHFSHAGSLQKAFDQGSVIATLAIICITAVSCLFLIYICCKIMMSGCISPW